MTAPATHASPPAGRGRARVLVGVDGSPSSIEALRWAARLAPALNAEIQVITTWQYPTGTGVGLGAGLGMGMGGAVGVPMAEADQSAAATAVVDRAVGTAFAGEPPPDLRTATLQGHPAQVLLDLSADENALMLIVGSRGHGGFVGLLIGATSAYCAEHATCPVLVVHADPNSELR